VYSNIGHGVFGRGQEVRRSGGQIEKIILLDVNE